MGLKKEELKEILFKKFTYINNDNELVFDYCNNCNRPVIQVDYNGNGFACEYCGSENISIEKIKEV